MSTAVLVYWAPLYVTVDTEAEEVVSVRLAKSGVRKGSRVSGQSGGAPERNAARLFAEALEQELLPEIEIR